MLKNTHLALAISDVGWGKFFAMLRYNALKRTHFEAPHYF